MDTSRSIEQLRKANTNYRELIIRFEEELKRMPEGSLNCKRKNGFVYFYHYIAAGNGERKLRYISRNEDQLITNLNRKRFIQLSITRLRNNVRALERFLKVFRPYSATDILSELPVASSAIGYTMQKDDCIDWEKEEYDTSKLYPERLMYGTINGLKVRSKSEAIIAGLLESNKIPFRYEAVLSIDEKTYYPDFTILRPRDKKILYWEHFGMMDDEEYALRAEHKLAMYRKNSIFPWNQLISTYETAKTPLDAQDIQSIIKAFLL
ncbi:MAG: hypothetical protein WC977_02650 [Anaerovoracaceae bacterium]